MILCMLVSHSIPPWVTFESASLSVQHSCLQSDTYINRLKQFKQIILPEVRTESALMDYCMSFQTQLIDHGQPDLLLFSSSRAVTGVPKECCVQLRMQTTMVASIMSAFFAPI